jgi:hypothetical protein
MHFKNPPLALTANDENALAKDAGSNLDAARKEFKGSTRGGFHEFAGVIREFAN